MSDWLSGDVIANGIRIHYHRTAAPGSAKPALVLSHGATDNGLCWTHLARALEADYDVIMPDARGHGLSDAPEDDYSTGARAADLAAFIKALELHRPAVGGHSMGAATTLRLIGDHPDIALCAILEDPGFRATPPGQTDQAARRERARKQREERRDLGRDGLLAQIRKQRPEWGEDEYGPWVDAQLQVSEQFTTAARPSDRPDWRGLLPRVTCPTLLITADPERGAIVTPETAEEAQRLLPSLQVVRIAGAGHSVRRENFPAYLDAVRSFLART
jgi:pimeloyl-ACP methyl ester carboxylesterase